MLDHIALQCTDIEVSATFYTAVLATLGSSLLVDNDEAMGFGEHRPSFWIGPHRTGEGFRETHIGFSAKDRSTVEAFFQAAVDSGAEVLYTPREWPQYGPGYFAAFVRDPDGNNVEAVHSGYAV
jgi:catechol 2,3-dioxygenase-like lactoylglutathione lyase family enzyme